MILTVTANASIDKRYLMESFEIGEVSRVKECTMSAGGKGLNVSRVVRLTGESVTATGFLGGHHGRFIQDKLKVEGIADDFIWCEGETRSCINIWDEKNKKQTELLEPGLTVTSDDCDALVRKCSSLAGGADVIAISGSLPKGADSSLYKRLIEAGKSAGRKVLLDTSGKTLQECVDAKPYMIKPNIDEIQQLTGKSINSADYEEILNAACDLNKKGIEIVVVSLGSEGSVLACKEGCYEAHVPVIEAVNTVGCGDSFIGGFSVGLSRDYSIEECFRLASAVSTASAMTDATGFYRTEDMEEIYKKIEILKVK